MFHLDYTVYENDNNFARLEPLTLAQVIAQVTELLADSDNVRDVTVRRNIFGSPGKTPVEMSALTRIIDKRHEQVLAGHTPEHDDTHVDDELAMAAATYATPPSLKSIRKKLWPFVLEEFDTDIDRLDQLAEAGAFILAEMERILRSQDKQVAEANAAFAELKTREAALNVVRGLKKED